MMRTNNILLPAALIAVVAILVFAVYTCAVGWPNSGQIIPELLTFVITALLVAVTWQYTQHTGKMAETMARQTTGDLLLRLNELYAQPETRDAIRFIHEEKRRLWKDFPEKRYYFGEIFLEKNQPGSEGDQLRWHLMNFWYTLAVLVLGDEEIIPENTAYARFGPPEVIGILEPIEAVLAYKLMLKDNPGADPEMVTRDWPPLKLFASWARNQKQHKPEKEQLPAFPSEFRAWAHEYRKRQSDQAQASDP